MHEVVIVKNIAANVFAAWLLSYSLVSNAVLISIEPVSQEVTVGSPVAVDVRVSGLGDGTAPSVGAFDFTLTYDSDILCLISVVFGPFLGDPALFQAITTVDDTGPGSIRLVELSLLEADPVTCFLCIPPFLDALQPANFTLATLTFDTLSIGTSLLDFSSVILSDAFGIGLTTDIGNSSVSAVPAPSSLGMLVLGLTILVLMHRRSVA